MDGYISLSHWGLHGYGISPQYAAELGRQLDALEAENADLRHRIAFDDDFTQYHG